MRLRLKLPTFPKPESRLGRTFAGAIWIGAFLFVTGTVFVFSFFMAMRMSMQSSTQKHGNALPCSSGCRIRATWPRMKCCAPSTVASA